MRPRKLIMSAFGPYANEEIIDFELLNGKNIFLITGATGAGKTTIFDAISYALFGEASGSTRENDSLRSDFAENSRLTFVELDFELRGEVYHIKRIPQQLRPKVKGEGFTNQGSEAELVLPNGKVRTGTNNVTNKITELLGINKDQFKQIVMLPQGEFKKLLLADSREREVIFRKIFGTYAYEKIQSVLSDKSKVLYKELEKSKDKVLTNVKNIKSDEPIVVDDYVEFSSIISKIEELIKNSKSKGKEVEKNLKGIRENIERLQEERITAERNNELLDEKKGIKIKIQELLEKKDYIDEKQEILNKISKGKEIAYIENELYSQVKNKEDKNNELSVCEKTISLLEKELIKAKSELDIEEGKKNERIKILEEINSLKDKKPKIAEFDKKIRSIKELKEKLSDNKKASTIEKKSLEDLKSQKKENDEVIKEISELEKKKLILEKDVSDKDKLINLVRQLYKNILTLKKYEDKHKTLNKEFLIKEESYKINKLNYENKQERYMKEQAGVLAMNLNQGEPCPVCGSLSHPAPAKRMTEVPTEKELEESKKNFEKSQSEYNSSLLEMKEVKTTIDTLINDVINKGLKDINSNNDYNEETEKEVLEEGKRLSGILNSLQEELKSLENKIVNKENINKVLENIDKEIEKKEKLILSISEEYTNLFGSLKGEEEILKSLEKEIPEGIRSIDILAIKIKELEDIIEAYEKALKLATDKVNNFTNKISSERAKKIEIEKIISELEIYIKEKNSKVKRKISECGFKDYDEYKEIRALILEEEKIKEEISSYKELIKSLKDRSVELEEKTKGVKYFNIQELHEKINKLKEEEVIIDKEYREIYSIISNNTHILNEIKNIEIKVKDKEEKYKVVGELAYLANGKRSPYITFERFVLASYFQEIIDSANLRLSRMTGERFVLKRKEDKGKGNSQQGLELEVYDNYTGKNRHVKTLSGGESFKASLALALGLSDVVQANAGGIMLDTIFIDEGFGSLDPESLENAINSLLDLQKGGRLVGIISHVPELKERIESKLEITTSLKGSSANFNI